MIICTRCGAQNPDGATNCTKCEVPLSHQLRARVDGKRANVNLVVRLVIWVAVLIVLAVVGPGLYHQGGVQYFKYKLKSVTASVTHDCGGPVDDSTQPYQRDQIEGCVEKSQEIAKAKQDLANFETPGARK